MSTCTEGLTNQQGMIQKIFFNQIKKLSIPANDSFSTQFSDLWM